MNYHNTHLAMPIHYSWMMKLTAPLCCDSTYVVDNMLVQVQSVSC